MARADGSAWGVRSPWRYGRNVSPSVPAGQRRGLGDELARSRRRPTSRSQRSDPAAESITPIASHVSGTAWQKTWTRACGIGAVPGQRREDDARRAEHDRQRPRPVDADAERARLLVARAADRRSTRAPGGSHSTRDLERVADLARSSAGRRRRRAASRRPRRRRSPARRSAAAGRSPSGSSTCATCAHTSGSCLRTQRSFGAVKPVSARFPVSSISRSRPIRSSISAHSAAVRWSFQRIAGRSTRSERVEQDEPVHLPGQPDRGGVVRAHRRERPLARPPPVLRVLLGPARAAGSRADTPPPPARAPRPRPRSPPP